MATCRSRKLAQQENREGMVSRLDITSGRTDQKNTVKLVNTSITEQYQSLTYRRSFFSYNHQFFEKFHLTTIIRKISTSCEQLNIYSRQKQTNKQTRQQHKQKPPEKKPKSKIRSNTIDYGVCSARRRARTDEPSILNDNTEHINPDSPKFSLDVIQQFSDNFCANINGNLDKIESKELNGGARIHKVFRDTNAILEKIDPLAGLTKEEILNVILNAHGICMSRYIPKEAFEFLLKKQIEQLRMPCLKSVDHAYSELENIINIIIKDSKLNLNTKMQEEMSAVALGLLKRHLESTKTMVHNILNINSAYFNYSHPRFFNIQGTSPGFQGIDTCDSSDTMYKMFQKEIERYFPIVRSNIKDMLPKIIICLLVNVVMKELYLELVSRLKNNEKSDLFQTSPKPLEWKFSSESISENIDSIINSPTPTNPTLTKTRNSKIGKILQDKRWIFKYLIYLIIVFLLLFKVIPLFLLK